VTLTVYKSSKMRLLAFRYKRFIEYDLIHDHFDVGATNPMIKNVRRSGKVRCKKRSYSAVKVSKSISFSSLE
jgi:hypothetical protein